jgi:hypothetical protein
VRIGQKAHIENQVGVGRNAIAKPKLTTETSAGCGRILEAVDDELAQLVHVEFRGVDDDVREARMGAISARSSCMPSAMNRRAQRMRPPRFAEAAQQRVVAALR